MSGEPQTTMHSSAHRTIPGTIHTQAKEGENTAYGLALYPVPSSDPNDPLLWSKRKKYAVLTIVSAYSFFANFSLLGPSVYIEVLADLYHKTPTQTSWLVTYPNLVFGFGSLVFVPMYLRLGRRPAMLISLLFFSGGLIGCAVATSYNGLMASRIISAFGSSVCEALPAQVISDIFFLHERGSALGWYTFALATGSLGALVASYVLSGGNPYTVFFWIVFAAAGVLFLATAFLFEETSFSRESASSELTEPAPGAEKSSSNHSEHRETITDVAAVPTRKTYWQQLRLFDKYDKNSPILWMIIRAFTYFAVPAVFWVCSTYGMIIGLAGLAFTTTFPGIVAAPPYNWPVQNTGLVSIAAVVGFFAAAGPFGTLPDRFAARLARKNHGIREAESRLWVLLVTFFISPCALILYGYAAQYHLHWFALVAAIGIFQFGAFFSMTYTLAYALDSYESNIPEMLIAMNVGKQAISFGFGYAVINWILEYGFVIVFAGTFCGALAINNLAVVGFLAFGKRLRRWTSTTWLAEYHRKTIRE